MVALFFEATPYGLAFFCYFCHGKLKEIMKLNTKLYLSIMVLASVVLCMASCAPQIHYMNVDVRQPAKITLPDMRRTAVFAVAGSAKYDSARVGNVAVGLAEKIEADRGLGRGTVAVWNIPGSEFLGYPGDGGEKVSQQSREYLRTLSAGSGASLLVFVRNLHFLPYSVQRLGSGNYSEGSNVTLPFGVDLEVYDALAGSLVHRGHVADSLYLLVDPSVTSREMGGTIAKYLPQMSKKIGAMLGAGLSPQWITQERIIFSYEGEEEWNEAYSMAIEFKWEEAIEKWTPLAGAKNPRKSACAAYNIAVGCEMLEGYELALKWLDYSLEAFPTREASVFRKYLENKNRPTEK